MFIDLKPPFSFYLSIPQQPLAQKLRQMLWFFPTLDCPNDWTFLKTMKLLTLPALVLDCCETQQKFLCLPT